MQGGWAKTASLGRVTLNNEVDLVCRDIWKEQIEGTESAEALRHMVV